MKNKNSNNDENKEFQHRPTIPGNKTASNLPKVNLYDNSTTIKQKNKVQLEPSKHMSLMFPWSLYLKLVEYSNNHGNTITEITIEALKQYINNIIQSKEIEELKERIRELEKNRTAGEHEFDNLEKIIKNTSQTNSNN